MKLHRLLLAACAVTLSVLASCQPIGNPRLRTDEDTLSYAFGLYYGANFQRHPFLKEGDLNYGAFVKGVENGFTKDTNDEVMTVPQAIEFVNTYFEKMQNKVGRENLEKGQKFLEENAKKEGVKTLEKGVQYRVITEGTGPKPAETDKVKVHYSGHTIDGEVFDSSYDRGEPAVFMLNRVIPGWSIALQAMPVGSKWEIFIPADQAYGERGTGDIKPNETLIFEVELIEIVESANK